MFVDGVNPSMQATPGSDSAYYAFLLGWPFESLGGVNGVLQNLLHEFQSAGEITPMAIDISGREKATLPPDVASPWPSINSGPISIWDSRSPWRSFLALWIKAPSVLWKLRATCRRYSIRVLNPHFITIEYFPLLLLRKLGMFRGQLILSFHGSDIRGIIQSRGMERWLFRMLLRGSDFLVACSDGLREEILDFVPECESRTVTNSQRN